MSAIEEAVLEELVQPKVNDTEVSNTEILKPEEVVEEPDLSAETSKNEEKEFQKVADKIEVKKAPTRKRKAPTTPVVTAKKSKVELEATEDLIERVTNRVMSSYKDSVMNTVQSTVGQVRDEIKHLISNTKITNQDTQSSLEIPQKIMKPRRKPIVKESYTYF